MRSIRLALALTAVLLLVGCGYESPTDTGPTATAPPGTSPTGTPSGEGDLVLRVTTTGGLLPPEAVFAQLPTLSLYADGRLIMPGAVPAIFPGPAVLPLHEWQLSPAGVQKVRDEAAQAGLLEGGEDLGSPPVADAGTTVFTVVSDGKEIVTSAYALEFETDQGLTPAQRERRAELIAFQRRLFELESRLGAEVEATQPFVPAGVAILIQEAGTDSTDPSGIEPNVLDWPLADLGTLGGPPTTAAPGGIAWQQAVVTGADMEQLRPLLDQATSITRWRSGDGLYNLTFRPLLPDELPAGG